LAQALACSGLCIMASSVSAYSRPPDTNAALTLRALREELACFAEMQLEGRLQELRESIIRELREGLARVNTDIGGIGAAQGVLPPFPPKPLQPKPGRGSGTEGSLSARPAENDARTILTPKGEHGGYLQLSQAGHEDGGDRSGPEASLLAREQPQGLTAMGLTVICESNAWNMILSMVVIMSALVIGFETDYMARHWAEESPEYFRTIDHIFCVFFLAELVIRVGIEGCIFFTGPNKGWNWFDVLVVSLQVSEVITEITKKHLATKFKIGSLSNLRMLRIVRIMRLGRTFHLLPSLRKLVVSITETLGHIWWPMVLILMVTYLYGVLFTQIVTDHKQSISEDELEHQEELLEYYGSLDRSMLTLFETVSEGIHWGEVLRPLSVHCSPWLTLAFLGYVCFVLFAVMNVITAFFVEASMLAAATEHKNFLAKQLWGIFGKQEGHGISSQEFYAQADHPQMKDFFEELKLSPAEAAHSNLFGILDEDGSGTLEVQELIDGCQRLLGAAKQVDLALFVRSFNEEVIAAREHRELVEAVFWGVRPKQLGSNFAMASHGNHQGGSLSDNIDST